LLRSFLLACVALVACNLPPQSGPDAGPNGPLCGNGVLDPGESCDTGIAAGMPGACPTQCSSGPCPTTLVGAGCAALCATAGNASCCGNGQVEPGEACDDGNTNDFDGCSSDCRLERALILKSVQLLPGDQGCDLDGDGDIDNALGGSGNTLALAYFSSWYTGKLASCRFRSIWVMRGADPTMQASWTMMFEIGQDATPGADPFSGGEPFMVLRSYADPLRVPVPGRAPGGNITAGPVAATDQPLPYCWTTPVLDVLPQRISHVTLTGTLTGDATALATLDGQYCGARALSSMRIWHSFSGDGSFLDMVAIGFNFGGYVFTPTQPDVDVDGDGLERLIDTDGDTRIDLCLDGDGAQITGLDCPSDPRMADAYSEAMGVHAVGAQLAGTAP
jgi:cysteine-rich repeat protein